MKLNQSYKPNYKGYLSPNKTQTKKSMTTNNYHQWRNNLKVIENRRKARHGQDTPILIAKAVIAILVAILAIVCMFALINAN